MGLIVRKMYQLSALNSIQQVDIDQLRSVEKCINVIRSSTFINISSIEKQIYFTLLLFNALGKAFLFTKNLLYVDIC